MAVPVGWIPRPRPFPSILTLLTTMLFGCGDGIPDFTPEELADATTQVEEAFHLRDYQYGAELGEKWAGWAPEALEMKAWTVANMARGRMEGPSRKMAAGMMESHPDSPWSSFAMAASKMGGYSMDDRNEALEASEKAVAGLPDLIDALLLRGEILSRFERDSVDAFFESLPEESLQHPDLRVFRASSSMPMLMEPPDSAIERIVATLNDVLEDHPSHIEANLSASSLIKYFLDDAETAESYVDRAAALSPSPMIHSMLWSGFMEDTSLTEGERLAKVEADARNILETAGESPARWAALAAYLGSSGLPDLQKEVEEIVLGDYPKTRAAEVVLGNRFKSIARDLWAAPNLTEDGNAEKRERLAGMLREFIDRREVRDQELLLEAKWNLFLLQHEADHPDPEVMVEVANGLVEHMETEPGSDPSTYYTTVAMSLAERTGNLTEANRIIEVGLAKLDERLAEEAAEEKAEGTEAGDEGSEAGDEEVPVGEAAQTPEHGGEEAEHGEEGDETESEHGDEGGEAEEEAELDPRVEAERARFFVAKGLVLTQEGKFEEAEEELSKVRELAEENRYASQVLPMAYFHSGQLMERRAEAAETEASDGDAGEFLRSADEFYKEGLRGRYYASPTQGQPWTNPNETALESLYERMHGDLEGFDDYLSAITDEGWEERKDRILARREGDPEPMEAFALETLDGEEITSEGLLGKVLVINFWGTW